MARFLDNEREEGDIPSDKDSDFDFKSIKVQDIDEASLASSSTNSDIEFTADEMKERSNLFQREFDQEELHDRVLVVQVMPDDYEIHEWRGHLEDYKHESDETYEFVCAADSEDEEQHENYPAERHWPDKPLGCTARIHGEKTLLELPGVALAGTSDGKVVGDEDENERESGDGVSSPVEASTSSAESDVTDGEIAISRRSRDAIIEVTKDCECFIDSGNPKSFSDHQEFAETSFTESNHEQRTPRENETGSSDGETRGVHVMRERRFYVHGCWLAVNSRYFRSLLYASGMKESSSREFTMKVAESEEAAFVVLLESIYNAAVLNDVDVNTLLSVLRLSVKYDVRFSFQKARRVLRATPLTLDVCETIIDVVTRGGMSNLDDVMENVEALLFREFTPLDDTWESDKFSSLSASALRILLASDKLVVQSENTVFVSLMRWIEKHSDVYEDLAECSELLSVVRFELMKPSYLNDVVRIHEVATQLVNFDATYLAAITWHALPTKRRKQRRIPRPRRSCEAKTPTYMWILDPDEEMFVFDGPTNSQKSLSFWYFGYKMHLCLTISKTKRTRLSLVVENMAEDGVVKLAYNVDVKFSDGLHKSYTCAKFEYRGVRPSRGEYPFDKKYSLEEIKEILLGGSVKVMIIFEISVEKFVDE